MGQDSQYLSSRPTLANGQTIVSQVDVAGSSLATLTSLIAGEDLTNNLLGVSNKAVVSSTYSRSSYQSAVTGTLVISGVIKSSAGQLLSLVVSNANAAARYLWIKNAAAAPGNADSSSTVVHVFYLPPSSTIDLSKFFQDSGLYFSTGISWGISTSANSYTAGTASEHLVNAGYL
jgi:hypothetical protein